MDQYIVFALIGLGFGALYAAIAMGVVITYRGTGVINFATGAMAMWGAYVYADLRKRGDLVLPVVGIPHRVHLADHVPFLAAFGLGVLSCAVIGLAVHALIFRPLRSAPVLAKVVASVGLLLLLQSLTALQFGTASRPVASILPTGNLAIGSASFPRDRLWLLLVVACAAAAVAALFRFTRFGLAARAAAESERTVALARWSPQLLAGGTWVLSSTIAGAIGVLVAPITVLSPLTYSLAIVPALAAALVGRFQSIPGTVVAALVLGSFQSVVTFQTGKSWWPKWAVTGLPDAVPFVVIVVALFALGDRLPTRGSAIAPQLPRVVRPRNRPWVVGGLVGAAALAILATSGSYRFGIITSLIVSIIMLSLVLLTGMVGQISLAQAALAGAAGFTLSRVTHGAGVPFPFSILIASLAAAALGVLIGLPALRIRGVQLAVVTLAGAVALERFVFRNPRFTSSSGSPITDPTIFGIDLAIRQGRDVARWQFGFVVLTFATVAAVLVGNIVRGSTGRRFLAVRSNERAAASVGVDVAATKLLAFGIASFLAGLGGALIGYSRGQLSADSFTALVGLSLMAFAYLGGITSIAGALIAGLFAPLGIGFVLGDRLLGLGNSYGVFAGFSLVITALFNPEGIAGATRDQFARLRGQAGAAHAVGTAAKPQAGGAARGPRRVVDAGERPVVLRADGVTVRYGGVLANDRVDLQVRAGQIVGLIGPNGAGKTTFIDALSGFAPATGAVTFRGQRLDHLSPHCRAAAGLVRTWQSVELFTDLTVAENLQVAGEPGSLGEVARDLIRPRRAGDRTRIDAALALMGLAGVAGAAPGSLSLGQQKLVGVARALARRPSLIMMDEPAAGLDTSESAALGDRLLDLADEGVAVLLVDHDMGLVLEVCDYLYVLDFGRIIAEGSPAEVRASEAVVTAYLGGTVAA